MMSGPVPWKEDLAKLISKKLDQAFHLADVRQVGDHIELVLDNVTYKLTITKKK